MDRKITLTCQGGYDVFDGPRNLSHAIQSGAQWPVNEPLAIIPPMAAATKNIGFGVTVATTYEQPYHLARRLSTVDHLTKGRYVNLDCLDPLEYTRICLLSGFINVAWAGM